MLAHQTEEEPQATKRLLMKLSNNLNNKVYIQECQDQLLDLQLQFLLDHKSKEQAKVEEDKEIWVMLVEEADKMLLTWEEDELFDKVNIFLLPYEDN